MLETPTYFVCVAHGPPGPALVQEIKKRGLPPNYALSLNDLYKLQHTLPGAAVTVEHAGIQEAVDSVKSKYNRIGGFRLDQFRDLLYTRLHDLGESDATKSVVGKVIAASVIQPSGALYALFRVDAGLKEVAWLIRNGFLVGVSITTEPYAPSIVYELSLTQDPARPHCFVVYSTADLTKAQHYMGKLINHTIEDLSSTLGAPTRVMAASATAAKEVPTPKEEESTTEEPVDSLIAYVSTLPKEGQELIIASLQSAQERVKKSEEMTAAAEKKAAEMEKLAKQNRTNSAMLSSALATHRRSIPKEIEYDAELDVEAIKSDNPDVVRAAWNQTLITASLARGQDHLRGEKRKNDDEEHAVSDNKDDTRTRMAALTELVKASRGAAPKNGGGPLTQDEMRTVAHMKLATVLDAFEPRA